MVVWIYHHLFPHFITDALWGVLSFLLWKVMCQKHSWTFLSSQEFLKGMFIGVKLPGIKYYFTRSCQNIRQKRLYRFSLWEGMSGISCYAISLPTLGVGRRLQCFQFSKCDIVFHCCFRCRACRVKSMSVLYNRTLLAGCSELWDRYRPLKSVYQVDKIRHKPRKSY